MTITSSTIPSPTIPWTTSDRSAVRTRSDDVRAVPAALRSEWIKLTALRANKVILACTAITGAVIAGAWPQPPPTRPSPPRSCSSTRCRLVAMLASVVGILMFTGEAQHGTLAVALVARPARWVIVVAKTIIAATVGLALGTTGMIAGFAGAAVGGVELGSGSALTSRALWALLYIALAALIGLGVGMIVRHSAGAITGLLMWSFVIESLFAPAIPQGVRHFLPFSAGYRLLDAGPNFEAPVAIADPARSPAVRPHLRRLRPRQPHHRHAPALPARHQLNPADLPTIERARAHGPGSQSFRCGPRATMLGERPRQHLKAHRCSTSTLVGEPSRATARPNTKFARVHQLWHCTNPVDATGSLRVTSVLRWWALPRAAMVVQVPLSTVCRLPGGVGAVEATVGSGRRRGRSAVPRRAMAGCSSVEGGATSPTTRTKAVARRASWEAAAWSRAR